MDDPKDGRLLMMLAQALFAAGEYDEAAGATQQAMLLMPEEQWGMVVSRHADLYADPRDYLDQLRELEKAVREDPRNPALRFELGFQYGYSGRPAAALRELDQLVEMAPQDQLGRKLRDLIAGELDRARSAR